MSGLEGMDFDSDPNPGQESRSPEEIAVDCLERWNDDWGDYEFFREFLTVDFEERGLAEDVARILFRSEDRDERIADLEILFRNFAKESAKYVDFFGESDGD